jgi:hypothetical protein
LAKAHAEHDRGFGDLADRNYEHPPEIAAAFVDSCGRSSARVADVELFPICEEMRPLETAINAAPVNLIEGLRAKALVAFREVTRYLQVARSFTSKTPIRSKTSSSRSQNSAD